MPQTVGLKPTATLKGRSATVEHQPALYTKRGIVPRIFRRSRADLKIIENNSVHVRIGRLNWVRVTERPHA